MDSSHRTSSLKVALLSETFSKRTGYLGNVLPKYMARLGAEVHLITMDLPPYHFMQDFKQTVANYGDPDLTAGSIEPYDGYTLHVIGHSKTLGYPRMKGLGKKLISLRPNVVQAQVAIGWTPLISAFWQPLLGYQLFTGCHMAASMFPLAQKQVPWWSGERLKCALMRSLPGRMASLLTRKCYAVTEDCALVAARYFGVQPHKVEVMYLGVDTEHFYPVSSPQLAEERSGLRRELGFGDHEIVCIYTGKFTDEKKLHLLLGAVERLRSRQMPFRTLFIGDGPHKKVLQASPGSVVLDFMPFTELGRYYRAADIGVWPGNESTSMLDAAACGLPIVISDEVFYRAPVEGNGKVFRKNDAEDLAKTLLGLREPEERQRLGSSGAARMAREFSWESRARQRLRDYEIALRRRQAPDAPAERAGAARIADQPVMASMAQPPRTVPPPSPEAQPYHDGRA